MEQQYRIAIEPKVYLQFQEESRREHRDATDLINEVLRKHLFAKRVKEMREKLTPLARAAGYNTDEDIFRDVS